MNKIYYVIALLSISFAGYSQTVDSYLLRGHSKYEREDYQGAIAEYNKAIEINPNHADAYYFRGLAKRSRLVEDYRGAIADFNKSIEIDPNHADAYYFRGGAKISAIFEQLPEVSDEQPVIL